MFVGFYSSPHGLVRYIYIYIHLIHRIQLMMMSCCCYQLSKLDHYQIPIYNLNYIQWIPIKSPWIPTKSPWYSIETPWNPIKSNYTAIQSHVFAGKIHNLPITSMKEPPYWSSLPFRGLKKMIAALRHGQCLGGGTATYKCKSLI